MKVNLHLKKYMLRQIRIFINLMQIIHYDI